MSETSGAVTNDEAERFAREQAKDRKRLTDLEERVAELEDLVSAQQDIIEDLQRGTTADDYEAMTAKEREQKVAQALRNKAKQSPQETAAMDYTKIVALFKNEIPNATAYKVMKRLDGRDGYNYESRSDGNNRVTCDVKELDGFSQVNKR